MIKYKIRGSNREGEQWGQIRPLFTFIDLFAGIGGMRLSAEQVGGTCVYFCEKDKFARATYKANHHNRAPTPFNYDVTKVKEAPAHDLLLAGFPCQPFSSAGLANKSQLGQPSGFNCKTQGTLFFDIARIIKQSRPQAFLLENVKNLITHDQGNTFKVIKHVLQIELGYSLHYKLINGLAYTPQHRDRLFLVGFKTPNSFHWGNLPLPPCGLRLESILHNPGGEPLEPPYTTEPDGKVNKKYTLSNKLWEYLQEHKKKQEAQNNRFGYTLVTPQEYANTLRARYYKDGSEILLAQGEGPPRRLTPRECSRLMGFPSKFIIPVSDAQSYRQFGNSVVVPAVTAVLELMQPYLGRDNKP